MTMEDRSSGSERGNSAALSTATLSSNSFSDDTSLQRAHKRTFDVAFLVAPDENLARRKNEEFKTISNFKFKESRKDPHRINKMEIYQDYCLQEKSAQKLNMKQHESLSLKKIQIYENSLNSSCVSKTIASVVPEISFEQKAFKQIRSQKFSIPTGFSKDSHMVTDKQVELAESIGLTYKDSCSKDQSESKSAFTKVSLNTSRNSFDDEQISSRSSISPDGASYQTSVSPPVFSLTGNTTYKYYPLPAKVTYPFLMKTDTQNSRLIENLKIPQAPRVQSPKMSSFRSDLSQAYPNLPYNSISIFPSMNDSLARPRLLTTAVSVAGLLPSSLAALTLPAQNVCAKCNLSFRMTSDLVYHMRSHHKNESSSEISRRRREEKLRCPVCDESFRERHHLTRHMTAHQDKESDAIVDSVEDKRRTAPVSGK